MGIPDSCRLAMAGAVGLIAIAAIAVLSGSPVRVARTSSVVLQSDIGSVGGGREICQSNETLPAATSAVRLSFQAIIGPRVALSAFADGRMITQGVRGSNWTAADVTVPVSYVRRRVSGVTLCAALGPTREAVALLGQQSGSASAASVAGSPLSGRVRVEYLEAGRSSWWSKARAVARRMGLGHVPTGVWNVLLIAVLIAGAAALACVTAVREFTSKARVIERVPRAACACALVAVLNAGCWSLLSPPFQTPDEPSHFAYVQLLAEEHRLPVHGIEFSSEENTVLEDLHQSEVQYLPSERTISSLAEQRRLTADLSLPLSRKGPGEAGVAASQPPLYYALEAIPYELGSSGSLLVRLELMRLLSALFGGLTALFVFLFVREALPRAPSAWTVGGLGVALAPLLGFMSGAVNPDAMLAALSALLFYLVARAFRRGLTPRLGGTIGVTCALGLLTKLNFAGLLPGALLALVVITVRTARRGDSVGRGLAYAALVTALALAAVPPIAYFAAPTPASRSSVVLASSVSGSTSVLSEISYIWQLYLPHLPGMVSYFPGVFTTRQLWFDGLVGLYGWADTPFPGWVYNLALIPATLLAILCVRQLFLAREAVRSRALEAACYLAMGVGVLLLVGVASYASDVVSHHGPFTEPRYLLPLLPLLGAALALAARGAGRRWGPVIGVLIIGLVLAHDIFSQLQVIARYYG